MNKWIMQSNFKREVQELERRRKKFWPGWVVALSSWIPDLGEWIIHLVISFHFSNIFMRLKLIPANFFGCSFSSIREDELDGTTKTDSPSAPDCRFFLQTEIILTKQIKAINGRSASIPSRPSWCRKKSKNGSLAIQIQVALQMRYN